jgi:ABC-type sugar transport system substrate-binding protein
VANLFVSLITERNDFQLYQARDARAAALRTGLDMEQAYADGNAVLQIQQLFRQIHAPTAQRPAALIVEPVTLDGMERVVRNAAEAGIGFVLMNTRADFLAGVAQRFPKLPIASVRVDQVEAGHVQGLQFRALLPSGGRLLYLEGPAQNQVARERADAMQQTVRGSGIDVTTIGAHWTIESAEKALRDWWRLKTGAGRPDLVGCQNDAMAEGARRAMQEHPDPAQRDEWARLPRTGVDGLPEGGTRMVDQGHLVATVIGPSNGGPAVELVARFLKGERIAIDIVQKPRSYPSIEDLAKRASEGVGAQRRPTQPAISAAAAAPGRR